MPFPPFPSPATYHDAPKSIDWQLLLTAVPPDPDNQGAVLAPFGPAAPRCHPERMRGIGQ